MNRIYF